MVGVGNCPQPYLAHAQISKQQILLKCASTVVGDMSINIPSLVNDTFVMKKTLLTLFNDRTESYVLFFNYSEQIL